MDETAHPLPSPRVAAPLGRYSRLAWYSLCALAATLPLATSNLTALGFPAPFTFDQFDLPKEVLLVLLSGAAAVFTLVASAARERKLRRLGWPAWAFVAFAAAAALATALSVDPSGSILGAEQRRGGLVTIAFALAAGWAVAQLVDRPSRSRELAAATVIGGALLASYGLLQTAGLDPSNWGTLPFEANRAFGTLGNPDLFGGYLIVPMALGVALALTALPGRARVAWWSASGLIALAWLLSFVRGAWIGGAVALAIVAWGAWRCGVRLTRADLVALGLTGLALVAAAVASVVGSGLAFSVTERLAALLDPGAGSLLQRRTIWGAAGGAVAERPLAGWGPDAFRYAFLQHRTPESLQFGAALRADDAHSLPIQYAVTVGIPGALAWLGGALGTLITSAKTIFAPGAPLRLTFVAWWAAAAGALVHLAFGVSSVASIAMLFVSLGVCLAPAGRVSERSPRPAFPIAGAGLVGAVTLTAFVALGMVCVADHAYMRSVVATDHGVRASLVEEARRVAPFAHRYAIARGDVARDAMAVAAAVWDDAREAAEAERAEQAYEDALSDVPREYDASLGLVSTLNDVGAYDTAAFSDALRFADAALVFAPRELPLHLERAEALANLGRLEDAALELEPYLYADPSSADAGGLYVQVLIAEGKTGHAVTAATELVKRYPDSETAGRALDFARKAAADKDSR